MADAAFLPAKVLTARNALVAEITSARILPGEQIDKTRWGYRLGLSAQPVSTALAVLAEEGYVSVVPQSGSYVARPSLRRIISSHLAMIGLAVAGLRHHPDRTKNVLLADLREAIARAEEFGRNGAFEAAATALTQGLGSLVEQSPYAILRREQRSAALYHHWAMSLGYRTGAFQRGRPVAQRRDLLNTILSLNTQLVDAVARDDVDRIDALVLTQHKLSIPAHRVLATELPDLVEA